MATLGDVFALANVWVDWNFCCIRESWKHLVIVKIINFKEIIITKYDFKCFGGHRPVWDYVSNLFTYIVNVFASCIVFMCPYAHLTKLRKKTSICGLTMLERSGWEYLVEAYKIMTWKVDALDEIINGILHWRTVATQEVAIENSSE